MVRLQSLLVLVGFVPLGVGCVEGFRGANVQIDLAPTTPAQVFPGVPPGANDLPSNVHYKLYAIEEADGRDLLFELTRFEVHKIVEPNSPCFIDTVGRYPGIHVTQFKRRLFDELGFDNNAAPLEALANPPAGASDFDKVDAASAVQRMINVGLLAGPAGIKIVSTASPGGYPGVDASCDGDGLPPPTCIDDAHNARRLAECRRVWAADPELFEGTDRVFTAPLNGTTLGFVNGQNPLNLAPVGGAQFFVDMQLVDIDKYAIFIQNDGDEGPGTLFVSGRPTSPTRGVLRVRMTNVAAPGQLAELAIFPDLGEDHVNF